MYDWAKFGKICNIFLNEKEEEYGNRRNCGTRAKKRGRAFKVCFYGAEEKILNTQKPPNTGGFLAMAMRREFPFSVCSRFVMVGAKTFEP